MNVEEVIEKLEKSLGDALLNYEIREYEMGIRRKRKLYEVWAEIDRSAFRKAVETIFSLDYPHLHLISGEDNGGDSIKMIYSFGVFYSNPWGEVSITLKFDLPKDSLILPTITDLMPGAETNEREIREMLGIEFEGLKNKRHLFLPDDWPEGKYPWRRDEYGVEDMIKHTHKSVREIRKKGEGNA
ncbi:NADH-quinone oxidoreductase subunit C [Thermococcus barophilus]|uniref:Membrane bound hydrogenase beta (NADH dehydrogenase) n=1 Tax=Thermococcus barophilus (strain DSM 11836 / MP) TaxID=391623 RepID=F0LIB9_THEBM|nr:NADH-quinone oxidoreductase subunit C [Thermococcus barophilus]ADT84449.1 membrane bound hydrogenase beta (NADH dehydrogenase) [Thermococcus barophilus MP]